MSLPHYLHWRLPSLLLCQQFAQLVAVPPICYNLWRAYEISSHKLYQCAQSLHCNEDLPGRSATPLLVSGAGEGSPGGDSAAAAPRRPSLLARAAQAAPGGSPTLSSPRCQEMVLAMAQPLHNCIQHRIHAVPLRTQPLLILHTFGRSPPSSQVGTCRRHLRCSVPCPCAEPGALCFFPDRTRSVL